MDSRIFELKPVSLTRLTERTGRTYQLAHCIVRADSEAEARAIAMREDKIYGIPWNDPAEVTCGEPEHHAGLDDTPAGQAFFQVID